MGELDVKVEASLGQLAVARGVISEAARERLARDLLSCARAGKPRSLARLLLQGGFTAQAVQELLQAGARLVSVRCDACGRAVPQDRLRKREEVPCAGCGSLLLGFAAYTRTAQEEEDTKKMGPDEAAAALKDETESWKGVIPKPGAPRESAETDRWKGVLPLPAGKPPGGTPPAGVPRAPRATTPVDEGNDQTLMFDRVLPRPGDTTVKMFPDGGPKTPAGPAKPSPFEDSDSKLDSDEVDRTITFGDVFLLPGRSAPRSEAEVTSEMNTLLAVGPALDIPRAPAAPPVRLTPPPRPNTAVHGPTPIARVSDPDPDGSITPPDFDPGGVTAPMSMNEIQAALAQGPPPRPALPESSNDGGRTISPVYPAPPSSGSDALPRAVPADDKRATRKERREAVAKARKSRRGLWLFLGMLLLATGAGVLAWWLRMTGRI